MCKLGFGEQVPKPKTCKYQVSGDKKTDIGLVWLWTGCMTRCPYKGQLKFNSPDERSSRRIKNRRNRGRQKEQQDQREKQEGPVRNRAGWILLVPGGRLFAGGGFIERESEKYALKNLRNTL